MHLIKDSITNDIKALAYVKDIDKQKNEEIRLKLKAERDTLTGLYNKGTTEKLINDFLNSEEASLGMHAFLIVDIDNFKSVNDNLGHVFGDKVLFEVSKNLKPIFRKDDIVGRIGGDEFTIFIKSLTKDLIIKITNDILNDASKIKVKDNHKITLSIGIAFTDDSTKLYKDLFSKADKALYLSKADGKNCYSTYE